MSVVTLAQGHLWVEELGSGEPALFIPGLGYASWCWRLQAPLSRSHRLLQVDPRGAGRSWKPEGPYTIEQMAAEVGEALERRVARAHVVGHSMGGYIALVLASLRPDLVRSLVVVASTPGGPESEPVPEATRSAWLAHAGDEPSDYARNTMHLSFAPGWAEEHPEQYEEWLAARLEHPTPPAAWAAQFQACERFLAAGIDPSTVDVPTLLVHGERDRVVPIANSRLLAARLPRARMLTMEGVGHLVPIEAADAFNRVVEGFWAGVELGEGGP